MTQPIARLYGTQTNAKSTIAALSEAGFRTEDVHLIVRPKARDAGEEAAGELAVETITALGFVPAHAAVYAEAVNKGKTLVAVKPPFGGARLAMEIMDGFSPIAASLPEVEAPEPAVGFSFNTASPTPLSDAFGWKVLLDDPTPLSTYMGWSVLKRETGPSRTLAAIRKQSDNPTPLSSQLGLKVLIDNPAPLSTKFGWKLLWDKATPLSDRFGWKLLWDKPTPLSDKFGWKLLLNNPTPLSSWLGLPVLRKD
jgi:hypothetical protein